MPLLWGILNAFSATNPFPTSTLRNQGPECRGIKSLRRKEDPEGVTISDTLLPMLCLLWSARETQLLPHPTCKESRDKFSAGPWKTSQGGRGVVAVTFAGCTSVRRGTAGRMEGRGPRRCSIPLQGAAAVTSVGGHSLPPLAFLGEKKKTQTKKTPPVVFWRNEM